MDWKSHKIFAEHILNYCNLPKFITYSTIYANAPDLDFFPFKLHRWRLHRISKFSELIDLVYLQRADVPAHNMAAVISFMSHLYLDAFIAPVYCFGYPLKTYVGIADFSGKTELTISLNQNKYPYAKEFYRELSTIFNAVKEHDPNVFLSGLFNELWDQTSNRIFGNYSKDKAIAEIKSLVPAWHYSRGQVYPLLTMRIVGFLIKWSKI